MCEEGRHFHLSGENGFGRVEAFGMLEAINFSAGFFYIFIVWHC